VGHGGHGSGGGGTWGGITGVLQRPTKPREEEGRSVKRTTELNEAGLKRGPVSKTGKSQRPSSSLTDLHLSTLVTEGFLQPTESYVRRVQRDSFNLRKHTQLESLPITDFADFTRATGAKNSVTSFPWLFLDSIVYELPKNCADQRANKTTELHRHKTHPRNHR
jgi:hypothetical protein